MALVVCIEDSAYDTEEQEQHEKLAPDAFPEGRKAYSSSRDKTVIGLSLQLGI